MSWTKVVANEIQGIQIFTDQNKVWEKALYTTVNGHDIIVAKIRFKYKIDDCIIFVFDYDHKDDSNRGKQHRFNFSCSVPIFIINDKIENNFQISNEDVYRSFIENSVFRFKINMEDIEHDKQKDLQSLVLRIINDYYFEREYNFFISSLVHEVIHNIKQALNDANLTIVRVHDYQDRYNKNGYWDNTHNLYSLIKTNKSLSEYVTTNKHLEEQTIISIALHYVANLTNSRLTEPISAYDIQPIFVRLSVLERA